MSGISINPNLDTFVKLIKKYQQYFKYFLLSSMIFIMLEFLINALYILVIHKTNIFLIIPIILFPILLILLKTISYFLYLIFSYILINNKINDFNQSIYIFFSKFHKIILVTVTSTIFILLSILPIFITTLLNIPNYTILNIIKLLCFSLSFLMLIPISILFFINIFFELIIKNQSFLKSMNKCFSLTEITQIMIKPLFFYMLIMINVIPYFIFVIISMYTHNILIFMVFSFLYASVYNLVYLPINAIAQTYLYNECSSYLK